MYLLQNDLLQYCKQNDNLGIFMWKWYLISTFGTLMKSCVIVFAVGILFTVL